MKNKLISLLMLPFLISCCANRYKKEDYIAKNDKDEFDLVGKKIASVDSIFSNQKYKTFFLFNYYDCGSCVDSGFSITKRIDSLLGSKNVGVISTMGDPSFYQRRNQYYDYIYLDPKDLIRKELKYVQTPIIFLLDSLNCVQDYILPNVSDDEEVSSFIKLVFSSVDY